MYDHLHEGKTYLIITSRQSSRCAGSTLKRSGNPQLMSKSGLKFRPTGGGSASARTGLVFSLDLMSLSQRYNGYLYSCGKLCCSYIGQGTPRERYLALAAQITCACHSGGLHILCLRVPHYNSISPPFLHYFFNYLLIGRIIITYLKITRV